MAYTLGQAAKAVGMSKTSILRSIKAGRIGAGRDEFGQWAIEPCEVHRVYPALTDDDGTGNGEAERPVTGGDTGLAELNARATLAEARLSDLKAMLEERTCASSGTVGKVRQNGSLRSRSRISGRKCSPRRQRHGRGGNGCARLHDEATADANALWVIPLGGGRAL